MTFKKYIRTNVLSNSGLKPILISLLFKNAVLFCNRNPLLRELHNMQCIHLIYITQTADTNELAKYVCPEPDIINHIHKNTIQNR